MNDRDESMDGTMPAQNRRRRTKGKASSPSSRSIHRQRSHDTSRAEAELEKPVTIPDHPLISKDEPYIIDTSEALTDLAHHVRSVGQFAYDTEFIGELSYFPKLCLVQIATHERIALIDPLMEMSLDEIWELIADPDIETFVHAAAQDLEPVARLYGKPASNIFDVQIAAGFAGFSYPVGLGRLIEEILSLKLGKGLTFTHWDHRPLSKVHARYAADDVRYLPAIREALLQRLKDMGHIDWVLDECQALADASQREQNPELLYRRIKGMHLLKPRKLAVLCRLAMLREQVARDLDVPPRSLIKDAVLIDLARNPVTSTDSLGKVPGLSRRVAQSQGEAITTVTREALEAGKSELPVLPDYVRETPSDQVRIDALNALAANLCYSRRIAPSLAVNRKDVAHLYFAHRRNSDLESCRLMKGWRSELLGHLLIEFIEGNKTVSLSWDDHGMKAKVGNRAPG